MQGDEKTNYRKSVNYKYNNYKLHKYITYTTYTMYEYRNNVKTNLIS